MTKLPLVLAAASLFAACGSSHSRQEVEYIPFKAGQKASVQFLGSDGMARDVSGTVHDHGRFIVVDTEQGPIKVARSALTQSTVESGTNAAKGVIFGALLGGGLGFLVGAMQNFGDCFGDISGNCQEGPDQSGAGLFIGAGLGGALGGAFGASQTNTTTYTNPGARVPQTVPIQPQISATPNGATVGVSVLF